jgi:hypothetical protein
MIDCCPLKPPLPSIAKAASLDWIVTATPPSGAAGLSVIEIGACRFWPTIAFVTVMIPPPPLPEMFANPKLTGRSPDADALTA